MNWLSWILVVALAGFILLKKNPAQSNASTEVPQAEPETIAVEPVDYAKSYQKKYLLTKNEYYECKKLMQYASDAGLIVCPKVRLLDIIEPRKGEGNYMSLLRKVQSKHVDFLICDKGLHVLGAVELDDNSHDQKNRQDRDVFVDQILQSVGYTVVHTRGITENTLDAFTAKAQTE